MNHDEGPASTHSYSAAGTSASPHAMSSIDDGREKRRLLRRSEMLKQLTPEKRAQYDRICKIREKIGAVDFKVVGLIRELRDDD